MENFIANVPAETYQETSIAGKVTWTSRYNLALWLGIPETQKIRLRLVLKFEDAKGMHSVLVDEASATRNNVLLSNLVQVTASGVINHMSIFLYSDSINFVYEVDELFAQRKKSVKRSPIRSAA